MELQNARERARSNARRISLRFAANFVISRKVGTHALEYRRRYRYSRRNSSALLSLTIPEQAGIVSQPYEKFIYGEGTRYLEDLSKFFFFFQFN